MRRIVCQVAQAAAVRPDDVEVVIRAAAKDEPMPSGDHLGCPDGTIVVFSGRNP